MGVGVQRNAHGGVPQPFGDDLRVYAVQQKERCVDVPEVKEPLLQTSLSRHLDPGLTERVWVNGIPESVGKDEVVTLIR